MRPFSEDDLTVLQAPSGYSESTVKWQLVATNATPPPPLDNPIDSSATVETKTLYRYFKDSMGKEILFGHQFTTSAGQKFSDPTGENYRSDSRNAVGSHPAMTGLNYNKDNANLRREAISFYEVGGIVTMHWPMDNPATGGGDNDTRKKAVHRIIPGGNLHEQYKDELDKLAVWFKSLESSSGELVPIIFRPFHENSGSGHWWGDDNSTPADNAELYRFTFSYLRDTRNVHNVLYAYAPGHPSKNGGYNDRYPDYYYVDIIAFEHYQHDDLDVFIDDCRLELALAKNKVATVAEAGVSGGTQNTNINTWSMSRLLNPIKNDTLARQVAYILTWTNRATNAYWVPLSGEPTYNNFNKFHDDPYTTFLEDLPVDLYE